jgi:hypothetical protein
MKPVGEGAKRTRISDMMGLLTNKDEGATKVAPVMLAATSIYCNGFGGIRREGSDTGTPDTLLG